MPKKRTHKEQKEMYELWQQSGLSDKEFCLRNHISTRTIWKWQKKFATSINNNTSPIQTQITKNIKFYPIGEVKDNSQESSFLEVTLPNGISCKAHLSASSINILLRELLR